MSTWPSTADARASVPRSGPSATKLPVRRGQQYSGLGGADCVGLPGVHIEVKRTNRLALYDALAQAKRDAPPGKLPIVAHRRDRCGWVVIMGAQEWFELYKAWEASRREQKEDD